MDKLRRAVCSAAAFLGVAGALVCAQAPSGANAAAVIVGGTKATIENFPYQVAVKRLINGGPSYQLCGGTILAKRWVLTAAHCFTNFNVNPPVVFSNPAASAKVISGTTNIGGQSGSQVDEVHVHPDWNPSTKQNDLALLKLHDDVETDSFATLNRDNSFAGDVTITGWGATAPLVCSYICLPNHFCGNVCNPGQTINKLRQVTIPIVTNATCKAAHGLYDSVTDNMICAGTGLVGGGAQCDGDSGGPWVEKGTRILVGVVSFSYYCALSRDEKDYSVATRVSAYVDWINETMK